MSNTEEVVTALVASLAYMERALHDKAIELRDRPDMSSVTCQLQTSQDVLSIYACVDAGLEGAHGVAWGISLWRRDATWEVDRDVTLYANKEENDVVNHLPTIECGSQELAGTLPSLVDELLRLPVPALPSS